MITKRICRCLPMLGCILFIVLGLAKSHAEVDVARIEYLKARLLALEDGGVADTASVVDTPVAVASLEVPEASEPEVAKEETPAPKAAEAEAPATGWSNAKAWDRIEPGMTFDDVTEILGRPERRLLSLETNVEMTLYFERTIHGFWISQLKGSVDFSDGKVVGIYRPRFK